TTITGGVLVAYFSIDYILYVTKKQVQFNRFLKADTTKLESVTSRMDHPQKTSVRIPETKDLIFMLSLALGGTGLASLLANPVTSYITLHFPALEKFSLTNSFFWLILFATLIGILLSFTRARKLENAGASKMATVLLYMLIVTIGMQMDITAILKNPGLFIVGIIWISIHALLLLVVGKLIKAPFFYYAI